MTVMDLTGVVAMTTTTAATTTTTLAVTTGIPVMDVTKETEVISPTDLPILQSRGPSKGYSYPVCTTCGRRHQGECRRAVGTCFKCGQAGHLQKDCRKNTTTSTSGQADKKPGASGRVFAITEGQAANTSAFTLTSNMGYLSGIEPLTGTNFSIGVDQVKLTLRVMDLDHAFVLILPLHLLLKLQQIVNVLMSSESDLTRNNLKGLQKPDVTHVATINSNKRKGSWKGKCSNGDNSTPNKVQKNGEKSLYRIGDITTGIDKP
nr:hypothetical protein [Tanacetum cinerariifolium]